MPLKERDIIKMRQDGIFKKRHSIHDDYVMIGGERQEFELQDIFPPMVRILLPKSFMDLPSVMARQKYPSEHRPSVIKTNAGLDVNFAFQYFTQKIKEEDVVTATRYYYGVLQKCQPGNAYLACGECYRDPEEAHVLAWYTYSNPTMTETVFNLHAYTSVEGRLLQCVFNAPELPFQYWNPYVFEALHSITSGRPV